MGRNFPFKIGWFQHVLRTFNERCIPKRPESVVPWRLYRGSPWLTPTQGCPTWTWTRTCRTCYHSVEEPWGGENLRRSKEFSKRSAIIYIQNYSYKEVRSCMNFMNFMNFMNMSTLRKWSQIISNHVMYGSAKTYLHGHLMTSQSLAKDVCKEQMPRGAARCREVPRGAARCRVASFSLRSLRLSKRLSEKKHIFTEQMITWCTLRLEFIANGRLERRWYTSKWCWNVNSSNFSCFILQALNCVHLHGTIVLDIFFISPKESKLKAVAHLSSLSSRPARCHPKTPGGPQPPSSWRVGSTTPNHPETLQSMNSLPAAAGEGRWGRAEVFGVRGDLPGRFTRAFFGLAKAWSLDFRFVSRYYWMIFGRANTHLFTRMNAGHGWNPMCKIVTMKFGQINDMPMKRCISMHLGDPHPRSCSQSFPGWNWQPTKTTELILIC